MKKDIVVSCGCCNKPPQTLWLKTQSRGRVEAEAGRRAVVEGSNLGSPPHLHASLLPLQPPDQVYIKPHGPQLVGLPDSWADVRVLLDADCDLTPVLPLHVCHGVEASHGNHRCHLQEG